MQTVLNPEEFAGILALDTERKWANQVSVIGAPGSILLVFREQWTAQPQHDNATTAPSQLTKNVASVVLPNSVCRELARLIDAQMKELEAAQTKSEGEA